MAFKVVGAINCIAVDIAVVRQKRGYYVQGRYQSPDPERFVIKGSVQNVRGRERLMLPEAIRTRETVKIYSASKLKTDDNQDVATADVIHWRGSQYEVQEVENWLADGGYYKIIASRVGQ